MKVIRYNLAQLIVLAVICLCIVPQSKLPDLNVYVQHKIQLVGGFVAVPSRSFGLWSLPSPTFKTLSYSGTFEFPPRIINRKNSRVVVELVREFRAYSPLGNALREDRRKGRCKNDSNQPGLPLMKADVEKDFLEAELSGRGFATPLDRTQETSMDQKTVRFSWPCSFPETGEDHELILTFRHIHGQTGSRTRLCSESSPVKVTKIAILWDWFTSSGKWFLLLFASVLVGDYISDHLKKIYGWFRQRRGDPV